LQPFERAAHSLGAVVEYTGVDDGSLQILKFQKLLYNGDIHAHFEIITPGFAIKDR